MSPLGLLLLLATAAAAVSSLFGLAFSALLGWMPTLFVLPFFGASPSDDPVKSTPSAAPSFLRLGCRSSVPPSSSAPHAVAKTSGSGILAPGLVSMSSDTEAFLTGTTSSRRLAPPSGTGDVSSDVSDEPLGGGARGKVGLGGREGGGGDAEHETVSGGHDSAASWGEKSQSTANTPSAGAVSPVDVVGFAEEVRAGRTTVPGGQGPAVATSSTTAASPAATAAAGGVELGGIGDRAVAAVEGVVGFSAAGGNVVPGGGTVVEEEAPDSASIAAQ